MERRSDKHNPRVDEQLEHEVGSLLGGTPIESHAEEWRQQESPAGELDEDEIDARSDLARHLRRGSFPGSRADLLRSAKEERAPEEILGELRRLPDDRTFGKVEVWDALGGRTEHRPR